MSRGTTGQLLRVFAILAFFSSTAGTARAADPSKLASELATIPYGAPVKLFQKYVSDRISDEYRPLIKNERNAHKRDQLKREVPEKIQSVLDTYMEFTGQKSGFDISVLSGEFRHSAGDAVMQEGSDRYYLFNNGRLWKVVKTVEAQTDFPTYALKLTTVFGGPDAMEFRDIEGNRPPLRVRWKIEDRVVEVADRRAEFGCYTIIVAKADMWKERMADRATAGTGGGGLSQTIRDVTGTGKGEDVSDIVDQLLTQEPPPPKTPAEGDKPKDDGLAPR